MYMYMYGLALMLIQMSPDFLNYPELRSSEGWMCQCQKNKTSMHLSNVSSSPLLPSPLPSPLSPPLPHSGAPRSAREDGEGEGGEGGSHRVQGLHQGEVASVY